MHRIDRNKVFIALRILIVTILVWPLIISTVVVSPKIRAEKEIMAKRGIELTVQKEDGYFNSKMEYTLTVKNKDKFLTYLSDIVKIDKALLVSIMPEENDVLGLQFGGYIATKVWKPFSVSAYMEPKDFPKNQLKLLEYKGMLQKFGATFIFNLRGKLKEVELNDIDLNANQFGINMFLNFVKPIFKLGDINKLSLEKYLIKTTEIDKHVGLGSNNAEYKFQYKDDYNFKFTASADDFLYYTKYNLTDPEDYTIYLAKKISDETAECKNLRCIKVIANDILENEKHIDSFEIYLDSRILDGIKYNNSGNVIYEIRHKDSNRNLEYKITYTKDTFKVPNVDLKAAKNSSSIEVYSDKDDVSIKTNTRIDDLFLSTANLNIKAKEGHISGKLSNVKLEPIKYIMDNTEEFSSSEIGGYSPLLKYVIEIANHGAKMQYGMEFSDLKFSKMKFPIKNLKIDADFVIKKNKYNVLNKPTELLKHITFDLNIKVDKESFENYLKSPMNEYKNLGRVVKYDGDFAILDINFNLKDDVVLANNKELIK
ncbi:MAG: hypothetical protein L0Y61_04995 [Epsilonproteobacteria bacterium]|nr:hypothetical protein [Campylobacterota bacterium]